MGTGEPLDNYDNVLRFIRLVGAPEGLNIGQRHISLSTSGLVPQIRRLAEEKLQIARRAVELIEEGSTIFLGTGTTVEQMASMLPAFRLRIVTNSLSVFNLLEEREDCDLCLVGGMYRRRTAAFVGPTAEDTLRALGIDAAFIGANGILDGDVSTSNMDEGRIQQLAFSKADSRYLIADSSKIGKRDFYTFCRLDSLDAVVCESSISAEDRAAIEEHTQVIC